MHKQIDKVDTISTIHQIMTGMLIDERETL